MLEAMLLQGIQTGGLLPNSNPGLFNFSSYLWFKTVLFFLIILEYDSLFFMIWTQGIEWNLSNKGRESDGFFNESILLINFQINFQLWGAVHKLIR